MTSPATLPPRAIASDTPLLAVGNLHISFPAPGGRIPAVDGVSFTIAPGERVCLVGESGCGKSITALSLLRLVPSPGRIDPGSSIAFAGEDLLALPDDRLRAIRGRRMAMIFQEPMTALNPVLTIGLQMSEALELHGIAYGRAALDRAVELLRMVGIPEPERRVKQ